MNRSKVTQAIKAFKAWKQNSAELRIALHADPPRMDESWGLKEIDGGIELIRKFRMAIPNHEWSLGICGDGCLYTIPDLIHSGLPKRLAPCLEDAELTEWLRRAPKITRTGGINLALIDSWYLDDESFDKNLYNMV